MAKNMPAFRAAWGTATCSVDDQACRYHSLQPLALQIPWPTIPPPDGIVTQAANLYTVSASRDLTVLSVVGQIGLGVPCDWDQAISNPANKQRLFVVPSRHPSIVWSGNVRPLRVYAKCE